MALVKVAETQEIPDGKVRRVMLKRTPVAIFNCGGEFFAIDDTCSHAEASLSKGQIMGNCRVSCPLHGAIFDIRTGAALTLPAVSPVQSYKVTLDGSAIMLEV